MGDIDSDLENLRRILTEEDQPAAALLNDLVHSGADDWTVVYADLDGSGYSGARFCCFLEPGEPLDNALNSPSWDLQAGQGGPSFNSYSEADEWRYEYVGVGGDGIIPLAHHRTFNDGSEDVIELAEDFRFLWQLREDLESHEFWTTDENGNRMVVTQWQNDMLLVRTGHIRRYQAARQLVFAEFIDITRSNDKTMPTVNPHNIDVKDGTYVLAYHTGQFTNLPFSNLLGKKLTLPPSQETYGKWPFQRQREYIEFIIGVDEFGRDVTYSSNPNKLDNNFGANPDALHYMTPAHFRRDVLRKYYDDSRYSVTDGYIRHDYLWGLRVDNNLADKVVVFLGDLGRDLPYQEQMYWRSFNIQPEGSISDTNFRRSFLGEFADPERIEFRFHTAYEVANDTWEQRFGWRLYLIPLEEDQHIIDSLHVPITDSFPDFDNALIRLAKLVVDHLNEQDIKKATSKLIKVKGGIKKLEHLLAEQDFEDRAELLQVLRDVQGARSRSSAHRKGTTFNVDQLRGDTPSLSALFESYLERLISGFTKLTTFYSSEPAEQARIGNTNTITHKTNRDAADR